MKPGDYSGRPALVGYPTTTFTARFANGQVISDPIILNGRTPVRVLLPPQWDAAPDQPGYLTFQESMDGQNWFDMYDDRGIPITLTVFAGKSVLLPSEYFGAGFAYLRIRSGIISAPIAQTAARDLTLITRVKQ